jgi:outer membrane autotransporter protein
MNNYRKWMDKPVIHSDYHESAGPRLKGTGHFAALFLITMLFGIIIMVPSSSRSQTLDDAVNAQLESIVDPCDRLFQNGGVPAPGSGLDAICSRSGGPGSTSASGGGAATPTTLPGIVKKRIKKNDGEEKSEQKSALLASASSSTVSTDADIEVSKRLGLFISGEYESLDRDNTTFASGYSSDIGRLIVGADGQFTDRILAGLAFDLSRQNGDFHETAGDFDIKSYGILAFGSFTPVDEAFIQVYGSYTSKSNERERLTSFTDENDEVTLGRPLSDFDTNQYSAGILGGYDFPLQHFTIGPRLGLDWVRSEIDSYNEIGDSGLELRFAEDNITSLQSTVGLMGSAAFSADFGVVVPQLSIYWKHEFKDDKRHPNVSFVDDTQSVEFSFETDEPDRDFFELNAGVSFVLPHGFQSFLNFTALLGHDFYDGYAGTIGLRLQI